MGMTEKGNGKWRVPLRVAEEEKRGEGGGEIG